MSGLQQACEAGALILNRAVTVRERLPRLGIRNRGRGAGTLACRVETDLDPPAGSPAERPQVRMSESRRCRRNRYLQKYRAAPLPCGRGSVSASPSLGAISAACASKRFLRILKVPHECPRHDEDAQ